MKEKKNVKENILKKDLDKYNKRKRKKYIKTMR